MYDPQEELKNAQLPGGEPRGTEQELEQELDHGTRAEQALEAAVKEEEVTAAETKPAAAPTPTPEEAEPTEEKQDLLSAYGNQIRSNLEMGFAVGTGVLDFGADLINKLPKKDAPGIPNPFTERKLPKFQNEVAQSVRELSSIVVPTIWMTMKGQRLGAGLAPKAGIGSSELVKWLGNTGVAAGSGAFVDYTNKLSETDDNLQGMFKKTFPKTFNWLSDDWATLDTDSPDVKRAKNVNEGVGLGVLTDFLGGSVKLLSAIGKSLKATGWIPESEQFATFLKKAQLKAADTPEEVVATSMKKREEALDEIGDYLQSKNPNLDEPMLGIHDVFEVEEAGTRSVDDMGVIGASVDAARIRSNKGTVFGRLGSIISEGALKFGLEVDTMQKRQIVKMITDNIKAAGKYSYEYKGGKVSFDEISKAGDELAEILIDPRMDSGMLKATLDEFKNTVQTLKGEVRPLDDVGYNAAFKALKQYMDEYINMDTLKAQAYLATSIGGQMADIAEGARYMEGSEAVLRAQEQILDRMEYLMVEKGLASYHRGAALNNLNLWNRFRMAADPKNAQEIAEDALAKTGDALRDIINRSKHTADTLRTISKERPEYLVPLQMAWEFTDGNIDTMAKLNNYVAQSLPLITKAFVDGQPQIPNVLVQGAWSNIYNSTLSAISTPLKAGFANSVLMLEKPLAVMGGAFIGMDGKSFRRGWYQYSAFLDSMQKGLGHLGYVFRKASSDPSSVSYIMRDDIVRRNEAQMDILHSFGVAADKRGNSGPLALYYQAEALNDLAEHPFLRFGANAMSALDGFTRAVIANTEARGRVWDKFIDGSETLTADSYKKASDEIYDSMFDSNGFIKDSAVDTASREIAMNLDSPAVSGFGNLIQRYAFLRPFFMFPRTSVNILSMADKHNPLYSFAEDVNLLASPKPTAAFSTDEIAQILTKKGIQVEEQYMEQAFNTLRAEVRGRKAVGTITIGAAVGLFLNDRLHGNGHYDKTKQRVRQELGWQPRTYKGWDGKWYSYDGLGPISDYMALVADIMDNGVDSLTENDFETLLHKAGFILSANLTNKSMMAGVEPMLDVFRGNPAAITRWAASFSSGLVPLSGARNELGRLMSPSLRELDVELGQYIRNRNKFLDVFDPDNALPEAYDWIDGRKINYSDSVWTRMFNAVSPMKVHDDISPERQFLVDIEYDARPTFNRNSEGVEYTPQERSKLFSIMGKDKFFLTELRRIMKDYNSDEFKSSIRDKRKLGVAVDVTQWENLYNRIDYALQQAKNLAENSPEFEFREDVQAREYEKQVEREYQRQGRSFILENK